MFILTFVRKYNIGLPQLKKGDCDGALISLQKTKAIYTHELGAEHPKTVQTNVYLDLNQIINSITTT